MSNGSAHIVTGGGAMNGIIPPGYSARLLGSATTFDGLNFLSPLEASTPEGSLMLMELDFEDFPTIESIESLNQYLLEAGIPTWPGNTRIVFAVATTPILYLEWVKGQSPMQVYGPQAIPWMPIIIGGLLLTILPVLLGGIIWFLIPQSIKDLMVMGGMMLLMLGMMQMLKPMLTPEKEKKRIEEVKE